MVAAVAVVAVAVTAAPAVAAASTITATGSATITGETMAVAGTLVASGPICWGILIGHSHEGGESRNFDCWKPILHDESPERSTGMRMGDLAKDERVKNVKVEESNNPDFPTVHMTNVWNETFFIQYVQLENGEIAGHAILCE